MAALTMERGDPEVSRFIDSYKLSQDMESRRAKFGGDTSLPLNSDGYEDKQRSLRDERHKDWLVQQEKRKDPVYYRVGTPNTGFPGLGEYNKLRQEHNLIRQKEYNDMLRKQRQMEQEKLVARRRSPPRPAQSQQPQMDYNRAGEQARVEEKRAYQDYMGNYQYSINVPQKPLMDYGQNKILLNEERRRDYNIFMEKKAKEERYWAMRGRPVTPAGGLDIGGYDRQVKETAQAKKKEYKEMLDQQQKEHMYLRARQGPEVAILDRNAQQSQYLADKPPPGPGHSRGRDEAETQRHSDDIRQQHQNVKPAEVVKNPYYSSDDYEKFQKEIQRKQGEEYKDFLSKKAGSEVRNRDWNFDQKGTLELRGDDAVQTRQRELRAERQKEYNTFMSQHKVTHPDRKHEFVDTANGPYGGLFLGLGQNDNRSDVLNRERHQEYNESLNQKYAGKERPSGRPNWAKDSLPNNNDRGRSPMRNQPPADQYQQMLDEKRREEASRRRYDDPEYQGRLAQGRDRGEAGPPRYGY